MNTPGIKSIAVNAIYLSSARMVTSVARAVYVIALAKWLGADLYGLVNYGLSWYLIFLPLSALGLDAILVREIGRDRTKAAQLVGQTFALRTLSSVATALLSLILALLVESDPLSRQLLFIFSIALFGRGLSIWTNAVFRAHEASGFVLGQEVVFRLLEVAVGVALLLKGFGVIEIAAVHAIGWVLQGAAGLGLIRRYVLDVRMEWNPAILFHLVKRGMPFVFGGFLLNWLLQGPILMYRHSLGIGEDLGQLALALQALFIVGAVVSEFGAAALPVLSRSVDRGDGKSDRYVDLVLRGGIVMSGVLAVSAISIGPGLVHWMFGPSYALTAELLPWTLVLVAPYFWMYALSSMIVAHGRHWMVTTNNAVGALVFTAAFPFLVSEYQVTGVVLALAMGLCSLFVAQLVTLWRQHDVDFIRVIGKSMLALGLAISFTFLLVDVSGPWSSLVGGLGGFLASLLALRAIRIGEIKEGIRLLAKQRR